jgi:hypothetical protein
MYNLNLQRTFQKFGVLTKSLKEIQHAFFTYIDLKLQTGISNVKSSAKLGENKARFSSFRRKSHNCSTLFVSFLYL